MQLQSFAFNSGDVLPPKYKGSLNPPFDIKHVPENAQSLAFVMHDPDAVSGDYVHWTIWDISPKTTEILEGSAPSGATEGITSAGKPGYVGPRPPQGSGRHHYTFELYALDSLLDLLPTTSPDELREHIAAHQLAKTEVIGVVDA